MKRVWASFSGRAMESHVDRYLTEVTSRALAALTGEGSWEDRVSAALFHLANGQGQGCPRVVREAIEAALALQQSGDLVKKTKAICDAIEEVFRNVGPDVPDDSAGSARN